MRPFTIIRKRLRLYTAVLGGFFAGALLFLNPTPTYASPVHGNCQEYKIPVALAPGLPKNKTIHGELCNPWSSAPDTVDVLIPGGTYDSLYWDFPFNNYEYSYVGRTMKAGRATFNFDRIGTGKSSKPLSVLTTFNVDVHTAHQVIQWLRSDRGYSDVTSIGHSMGSVVALQEAALHHDVDRVVATGFLHSPSFNLLTTLSTGFQPAILDPRFAGLGLDAGYITTLPGQREKAFYSSSADRAVVAYDEARKNIVSLVALKGAVPHLLAPPLLNTSRNITAPVLTIVGSEDLLCGTLLIGTNCSSATSVYNYEKPYYPNARSYTAHVVPDTGHNLPLHPSADESFRMIDQWIRSN